MEFVPCRDPGGFEQIRKWCDHRRSSDAGVTWQILQRHGGAQGDSERKQRFIGRQSRRLQHTCQIGGLEMSIGGGSAAAFTVGTEIIHQAPESGRDKSFRDWELILFDATPAMRHHDGSR
ncbi:MAG: hypothetical protein WBE58_04510 [Verrucomicrobiales bacterium]